MLVFDIFNITFSGPSIPPLEPFHSPQGGNSPLVKSPCCISNASLGAMNNVTNGDFVSKSLCVKVPKGFKKMRWNESSFFWAIYKTENYPFNFCTFSWMEDCKTFYYMSLIIFLIVGDSVSTGYIGKENSPMARRLSYENLLSLFVWSIINYFSNVTEV